jgi:hypothetical protein
MVSRDALAERSDDGSSVAAPFRLHNPSQQHRVDSPEKPLTSVDFDHWHAVTMSGRQFRIEVDVYLFWAKAELEEQPFRVVAQMAFPTSV